MKLFGYELKLAKAPAAVTRDWKSPWQLRPNDGQGPYTRYFQNFIPRKVEASFYEFLREAIPVIDAAINRLVSLDGHIEVEGENEALVDEIKEWIYNVPVNDVQKGLHAFHQNFTNEAFEQGFAIGEFVSSKKRDDIVGLRVADSKWIKFKRTEAGIDIYQKSDNDLQERVLDPSNLLYFSINNENQNPYGTPLMRSCEFVSQILVTMQNSLKNVWERFGDPSFSIIYKTSKKDGVDLVSRRQTIEDEFNTAIRAKREGKSADFIRAIDQNSDIAISIIGAANQLLEFEIPARHLLEQVIAKSGIPSWMLGMHWSTTERLSDVEAEMLLADVNTRQSAKMPIFYNIVRNLLLLRGRTWKKGDWSLQWAQVNLRDILKQAQARFMNAQADMYDVQNAVTTGKSIKQGSRIQGFKDSSEKIECSCHSLDPSAPRPLESFKELNRPTPWPELDKVETDYENELKYEWNELKEKIVLILKLNDIKFLSFRLGRNPSDPEKLDPSTHRPLESSKEIPSFDTFTFTEEQRAQILQALRNNISIFDLKSDDSPVKWYYGQAYSLGLIQAVKLIGKERPILDIIKNREIYDTLCKNGFQLVKDNANDFMIKDILPTIEAHVIAGSNPRQVAGVLDKLFAGKNSDWERLARTEMSSAAEQAKLDEWAEWGIKKVRFVPAPDGCPICFSLAGEYTSGQCPIPGTGTHPRCRCSIVPA